MGLIGGSVALALKRAGWHVTGDDSLADRVETAMTSGVVDAPGVDPRARVSVVAVPVDAVVAVAERLLAGTEGAVTDVASVKRIVVDSVRSPRFIGGHPMAGSELDGLDGADASMFEGAAWVLAPTDDTSDATFAEVASMVRAVGAEVVVMAPEVHDALVAVTSHVPHLVAASLMCQAEARSSDALSLPRLAAGGFRDMTRVASGRPEIWRSICARNAAAIDHALGELVDRLEHLRAAVRDGELDDVMQILAEARVARRRLIPSADRLEEMDEMRVPIPDKPGAAAAVFTLAAELGVNVHDFEITHSAEGSGGVVTVVIARDQSALLRGGLLARGLKPSVHAAI